MNANDIRNEVLSWMRYLPTPDFTTSKGQRGQVIGLMDDALRLGATVAEANQRRREVLAWLFRDYIGKPNASAVSSKDLPDECWWALCMFTDVRRDGESNKLMSGRDTFANDMVVCWSAMARWYDEMNALCGVEQGESV